MSYIYKITTLIFLSLTFNTVNAQQISYEVNLDLRKVEEKYPDVFTNTKPHHPDTAYEIGKKTEGFINDYSGENGKIQFYLDYAKHLQTLNKNELTESYRPKIIQLYLSINNVNQFIDTKVGYYEQMQSYLVAYAEYAMYEAQTLDATKFANVDVNKQKKLFIKSVEQKVKTKNQQLNLASKPNYNKNQELIKKEISKIESLITDAFILKTAQVFHYTYY